MTNECSASDVSPQSDVGVAPGFTDAGTSSNRTTKNGRLERTAVMSKKKGTSPWIWIGCGCFLCVALIVGAIVGAGFAGFSWVQSLVDDMADPQARTAAALDMLGAEALPPNYHARAFFNLPFLMELVILSDGAPPAEINAEGFEEKAEQLGNLVLRGDDLGANTLIYLKLRQRDERDPIEDVLAGRGQGNTDIDLGLELDAAESLGEGELEIHGERVTWRAYRGKMDTVGGDHGGIFAAAQVFCEATSEVHDFLWFQKALADRVANESTPSSDSAITSADEAVVEEPSVAAETSMAEAGAEPAVDDIEGSPADPEALSALLSHFQVCG